MSTTHPLDCRAANVAGSHLRAANDRPETCYAPSAGWAHLNDDDIYIIDVSLRRINRVIGCKSPYAIAGRLHGFPAHPGQMVMTGMQLRPVAEKFLGAV